MFSGSRSVSSDAETSQSKVILKHFTTLVNGDRQCNMCQQALKVKVFSASTSSSSLGWHLRKHNITIPDAEELKDLKKQRMTSPSQPSIREALAGVVDKKPDSLSATNLKMAVSMLRKHPGLPLSLFDSPAFLKPWSSFVGINRHSVRRAVLAADKLGFASFSSHVLKNAIVGLQVDGGKNVSSTKLIGEGVVVNSKFYAYDLIPIPDGDRWDGAFYGEKLLNLVEKIECEGDCLVAGITMDNEAALHAGFREVQIKHPHVYGNRCTCHTTELLIGDLQNGADVENSALPVVARVLDATFKLVTHWC